MKDICCIGHITRDKIVTPRQTVYMAGGTSFYFAYALNALPQRVPLELVKKVGNDGLETVEQMRQAGINVRNYASAHTVFFENIYGEDQSLNPSIGKVILSGRQSLINREPVPSNILQG